MKASRRLGGGIAMFLIQLGELAPGGVGSGLYGMAHMAILAVFVAGLMVGRTPEYLGKKIEAREVKFVMLSALIMTFSILCFSAVAAVLPIALKGLQESSTHGLSEILYAYTSATGNNGSAFAGLSRQLQLVGHHHGDRHGARPLWLHRAGDGGGGRHGGQTQAGPHRRDPVGRHRSLRGAWSSG